MGLEVRLKSKSDAAKIGEACSFPRGTFGATEDRDEDGDQNADDRDARQHLDEGERGCPLMLSDVHPEASWVKRTTLPRGVRWGWSTRRCATAPIGLYWRSRRTENPRATSSSFRPR